MVVWRERLMRAFSGKYLARLEKREYRNWRTDEEMARLEDLRRDYGDAIPDVYIEIKRRKDEGLVAVLELMSLTSKTGSGRAEYLESRNAILRQNVHLVEVDLLLSGARAPFREPLPGGDFFVTISRANRRPFCEVYPWRMPERLPVIPIPLEEEPDATVDLQEVFTATFNSAPYDCLVRYDRPVGIPVSADTQKWIDERVRSLNGF